MKENSGVPIKEHNKTDVLYTKNKRLWLNNKFMFGIMLLSASVCLLAAFVLSVDAVKLAEDPYTALSCNINSTFNCANVALSDQAQIFGFPNAFLGLICETVVITIAVAGLSGVSFPKWMMNIAQIIYLLGLVFAFWLFYQSAYNIHSLCPWCLTITFGTIFTFFTLLRYNILNDKLYFTKKVNNFLKNCVENYIDILIVVILLITAIGIIIMQYGSSII